MIFSKRCAEPWERKNTGLVYGCATGPGNVEWARGAFLPVPGAVALEVRGVGLVSVFEEPQRPRGSQGEAERLGPDKVRERPTRILAQASAGLAVPTHEVDGPAVAIRPQDVLPTAAQVGGEEGAD
jgi:hypothetical protein